MLAVLLGCGFFLLILTAGGLGAWWWMASGSPPVAGGAKPSLASPSEGGASAGDPSAARPSLAEDPAATNSETATSASNLAGLAGVWELDPSDPNFDPDSPADNQVEFELADDRLVARETGGGSGRIVLGPRDGDRLGGRYEDGADSADLTAVVGPGEKTMVLTVGTESVHLRRAGPGSSAPSVPGAPSANPRSAAGILYHEEGDVDGDGAAESVQVVSLDGNLDPSAPARREMRIYDTDGTIMFRTPEFREPFNPDLDDMADGPENTAGVHLVQSEGPYPDIKLVFVPASGNFVVFGYDGQTWQVVGGGD